MHRTSLISATLGLSALLTTPLAAQTTTLFGNHAIQGSVCLGLLCNDLQIPSGIAAVKIRTTNPGLLFEDTGPDNISFPTRDWRFEINSNQENGGEYFALVDVDNSNTKVLQVDGTAPANSLFVAANGNLGLGTSLPQANLHIASDTVPGIQFEQTAGGGQTPYKWDLFASDTGFFLQNRTATEAGAGALVNPLVIAAAAPDNALSINGTGVGFGTTPATNLHLVDGTGPRWRMEQTGATPYIWDTVAFNGGYQIQDITATNATGSLVAPFAVQSGSPTDALNVGPSGIGMGTGIPAAPLHVRRASTNTSVNTQAGILVEDTGTVAPRGLLTLRNQGQVFFSLEDTSITAGPNTGRSWNFQNLGGEFRVTTAPGGGSDIEMRLTTGGDMIIEGNYFASSGTQLNVPDYVFDADYDLKPLSEVQAFIDTHSHLPGVPSAADINETGLNMTDMQMVQLKKIEELTLYTLAQEAEIAQLRETVADMAALKARLVEIEQALARR